MPTATRAFYLLGAALLGTAVTALVAGAMTDTAILAALASTLFGTGAAISHRTRPTACSPAHDS